MYLVRVLGCGGYMFSLDCFGVGWCLALVFCCCLDLCGVLVCVAGVCEFRWCLFC